MNGFVDVETLLIGALTAQFPGLQISTITPPDLTDAIQVERVGGGDAELTLDDALMDVECYSPDRILAKARANQVRAFMRFQLPGYTSMCAVVTNVLTSVGPSERPYGNPGLFRIGATYQVSVQNQF